MTVDRHVALHDRRVQAVSEELVAAIRAREPAAFVLDRFEVDDDDAGDLRLGEAHQTVAPSAAFLLGAQANDRRGVVDLDCVERHRSVPGHGPDDARVFGERDREEAGRVLDGRDLPVAAVAADPVERVAGSEVALRDGDDVGDRRTGRAPEGIPVERDLGDRTRHVELHERVRVVNEVLRSGTELVETQRGLDGIGFGARAMTKTPAPKSPPSVYSTTPSRSIAASTSTSVCSRVVGMPRMPRHSGGMPVRLATTACSMFIFVPSPAATVRLRLVASRAA